MAWRPSTLLLVHTHVPRKGAGMQYLTDRFPRNASVVRAASRKKRKRSHMRLVSLQRPGLYPSVPSVGAPALALIPPSAHPAPPGPAPRPYIFAPTGPMPRPLPPAPGALFAMPPPPPLMAPPRPPGPAPQPWWAVTSVGLVNAVPVARVLSALSSIVGAGVPDEELALLRFLLGGPHQLDVYEVLVQLMQQHTDQEVAYQSLNACLRLCRAKQHGPNHATSRLLAAGAGDLLVGMIRRNGTRRDLIVQALMLVGDLASTPNNRTQMGQKGVGQAVLWVMELHQFDEALHVQALRALDCLGTGDGAFQVSAHEAKPHVRPSVARSICTCIVLSRTPSPDTEPVHAS